MKLNFFEYHLPPATAPRNAGCPVSIGISPTISNGVALGYRKNSVSVKISRQNQYADGADDFLDKSFSPKGRNNESVKKKKRKNHSGFMYANPKKLDKIEWEFCFFLTWDLLYAALQF